MKIYIEKFLQNKFEFMIITVLLILIGSIYVNTLNVGFWRHDCWMYTGSELSEFKHNGRWLVPILHYFGRFISPYFALFTSLFLLYYFLYVFIKRFLGTNYKFSTKFLPFIPLISPALFSQLFWPIHTLSAIVILALAAYFTREKSSFIVMFLVTILTFATLQTFAFLSLLLAIPSYQSLVSKNNIGLIKKSTKIILLWGGSIVIAYVVSKIIQYIYFGEFPALPDWRKPNPVSYIGELLSNLIVNYNRFSSHLKSYFNAYTFIPILVTLLVSIILNFYQKNFDKLKITLFLIMISILLSSAVYLITAPLGTVISFRSTINLGIGLILIYLILLILLKRYRHIQTLLSLMFIVVIIKPFMVTYYNTKYYNEITNDIYNTFFELQYQNIRQFKGIVIGSTAHEKNKIWDLSYHLNGQAIVIEGLNSPRRINRAFTELGYTGKIIWCFKDSKNKECQNIEEMDYNKCAYSNSNVCTATDSNQIWHLVFK